MTLWGSTANTMAHLGQLESMGAGVQELLAHIYTEFSEFFMQKAPKRIWYAACRCNGGNIRAGSSY